LYGVSGTCNFRIIVCVWLAEENEAGIVYHKTLSEVAHVIGYLQGLLLVSFSYVWHHKNLVRSNMCMLLGTHKGWSLFVSFYSFFFFKCRLCVFSVLINGKISVVLQIVSGQTWVISVMLN
jgi:hypothetical protein